jgi:hypothetical protein
MTKRALIAVLLVAPAVAATAPGAFAQTVNASADAWVTDRYPNRNHGADSTLRAAPKPLKRTYVRFSVPALEGEVQRAALRIYSVNGAPNGLRVYTTATSWGERTITHANAPTAVTVAAVVPGFTAQHTWLEIDVTASVTGSGAKSFLITAPSAPRDAHVASRETSRPPQLMVTTGGTPPPPSPTAPASTSAPTVSGTAQQSQTLTASSGSWTGSTPITYGYQWRRCNTSGGSCTDVSGATGPSYALAAADVGATIRVRVSATNSAGSVTADSAQTAVVTGTAPDPDPDPDPEPTAGTTITTTQPWSCTGSLAALGPLPMKVVSTIPNASASDNDNAINLRGCYGDGDPSTIDLILDIRGNGGSIGTSYDAVRIGQNARDLVVTGSAECGARNPNPAIHQDIVQALSGSRITFVDFTSGDPFTGLWTCWGAGGGWYITWANGNIPTDLICLRCVLATSNQNLRIGESIRSGARDSVFGYSRSYGIFVETVAQSPVDENNRLIRY